MCWNTISEVVQQRVLIVISDNQYVIPRLLYHETLLDATLATHQLLLSERSTTQLVPASESERSSECSVGHLKTVRRRGEEPELLRVW